MFSKFLNLFPSYLLYSLIILERGFHFLRFYFRKMIQVRQTTNNNYLKFNDQKLNYLHAWMRARFYDK